MLKNDKVWFLYFTPNFSKNFLLGILRKKFTDLRFDHLCILKCSTKLTCDICEEGGDGVMANGNSNCVNFGVGGVGGSFQGQVEVVIDELALLLLP